MLKFVPAYQRTLVAGPDRDDGPAAPDVVVDRLVRRNTGVHDSPTRPRSSAGRHNLIRDLSRSHPPSRVHTWSVAIERPATAGPLRVRNGQVTRFFRVTTGEFVGRSAELYGVSWLKLTIPPGPCAGSKSRRSDRLPAQCGGASRVSRGSCSTFFARVSRFTMLG